MARYNKKTRYIAEALSFLGLAAVALPAEAAPIQDTAVAPTAGVHIDQGTPNTTNITATAKNNVIAWRDFSVKHNETVNFDSSAHTNNYLNVVTGKSTSQINGAMQGGKNVYVINEHGVVFGKDAKVNVGNLYVSTRHVEANTLKQAADTANANNQDIAVSQVLPQLTTGTTMNVADSTAKADVVSLVDGANGSIQANSVVVEGNHIRFMNSGNIQTNTAPANVQLHAATDGYIHVGNEQGSSANYQGNVTPDYYKLVSTASDLENINNTTNGLSQNYMLRNDVDASSVANWTPIGSSSSTPFTGKFDGMMHEVQNLTINAPSSQDYQGLFGYTDQASGSTSRPRIDNLGIRNARITANNAGGIIGNAKHTDLRAVYDEAGTIGNNANSVYVGGILGSADNTNLDTTYNTSEVQYGSGIVYNVNSNVNITNAYNTGNITGAPNTDSFAIVGTIAGINNNVRNVYSTNDSGTILIIPRASGGLTTEHEHVTSHPITAADMQASTYTAAGFDGVANEGGQNTTWRIYEGQSLPLLTAFMKGTVEANYSYADFQAQRDAQGAWTPTDTRDTAVAVQSNNGQNITKTYNSDYVRLVDKDNPNTPLQAPRNVDFTGDVDTTDTRTGLGYKPTRNATTGEQAFIYSGQLGYDIVGGNITVNKRRITASTSSPITVNRVYDGTADISTDEIKQGLAGTTASYEGLIPGDGVTLNVTGTAQFQDTQIGGVNVLAKNVGYGKKVDGRGLMITAQGTQDDVNNYELDATALKNNIIGNVTPRTLTVSLKQSTGINKTYDGTTDVIGNAYTAANNVQMDSTSTQPNTGKVGTDNVDLDTANVTVHYTDPNAGTNKSVAYQNISLTGTDALNYQLRDANGNLIYAQAVPGAPNDSPYSQGATKSGSLMGTGEIYRRQIKRDSFSPEGQTQAEKTYDGNANVLVNGNPATTVTTSDIADNSQGVPTQKDGILSSEQDKIRFQVAGGATFKQGDKTTDAVDAVGNQRAQYASYNVTASNTDNTKDWLANYEIVDTLQPDQTTGGGTTTQLQDGGTAFDVTGTGRINKRTINLGLTRSTGIDKVYDGTDNAADVGYSYTGASVGNVNQQLVNDGTTVNIVGHYQGGGTATDGSTVEGKDVFARRNADGTLNIQDKNINYTLSLTGKGYNYDLNGQTASATTDADTHVSLTATGKITPKDLNLSFPDQTKVYDGNANAQVRQPTMTGNIASDNVTANVQSAQYTDANYNPTPNVKDARHVTYSGITFTGTKDNYNITGDNVTHGNTPATYNTYSASGVGSITRLQVNSVNITHGNIEKTYDADNLVKAGTGTEAEQEAAGRALLTGITDTASGLNIGYTVNSATYDTPNAGSNKRVDFGLTLDADGNFDLSGLTNPNLTQQGNGWDYNTTGNILRKKVTARFTNDAPTSIDKVYNGQTNVVSNSQANVYGTPQNVSSWVTIDGLLTPKDGAVISTSGLNPVYDSASAGDNKTVTFDLNNSLTTDLQHISQGFNPSQNYEIVDAQGQDISTLTHAGKIERKNVFVSPVEQTVTKIYDGTTALPSSMGTGSAIVNMDGLLPSDVSHNNSTGAFNTKNTTRHQAARSTAQNPQDVHVNYNISFDDPNVANNYNVYNAADKNADYTTTQGAQTITILQGAGTITPRELDIAGSTDVKKAYDGTDTINAPQGTLNFTNANSHDVLTVNGQRDNVNIGGNSAGTNMYGRHYANSSVNESVSGGPANEATNWAVYTNVQLTGDDADNYDLYSQNSFGPNANGIWEQLTPGADGTYTINGFGEIDRLRFRPDAVHLVFHPITKIYDSNNLVEKDNDAGTDRLDRDKELVDWTQSWIDVNNQHLYLNDAQSELTDAIYTTGQNVAANTTAQNNVQFTFSNIWTDNYQLDTSAGNTVTARTTGTITPRSVQARVQNPLSKVYDGGTQVKDDTGSVITNDTGDKLLHFNTQGESGQNQGWIDGTHTVNAVYTDKNAGNNKNVTYTVGLDNESASNYNITYTDANGNPVTFLPNAPGTLSSSATIGGNTITRRHLTITAQNEPSREYNGLNDRSVSAGQGVLNINGTPVAVGSTGDNGLVTGDTVNVSGTASYANGSANADTNTDNPDLARNSITYSGVGLNGADAANYQITQFIDGSGTKNVTEKDPSSDTSGSNTYDDITGAFGRIWRKTLNSTDVNFGIGDVTKIYDGQNNTNVEYDGQSDANSWAHYINSATLNTGTTDGTIDLGTGDYTINNAVYQNSGNVADNGTGSQNNVTFTFNLNDWTNSASPLNNYRLAPNDKTKTQNANGTITPREVTATLQGPLTKTYDGKTDVKVNGTTIQNDTSNQLINFAGRDGNTGWIDGTHTVNAAYTDKNAGLGNKDVTYTVNLDPNSASNYNIHYYQNDGTTPVTFNPSTGQNSTATVGGNTIERARLTITTPTNVTKTYDGTTKVADNQGVLTVNTGDLQTNDNGVQDVVTVNQGTLTDVDNNNPNVYHRQYNSPHVSGSGATDVTYSNVALTGTDAGNYYVANGTDDGTGHYTIEGQGTITPLTLTGDPNPEWQRVISKEYDGNTNVNNPTSALGVYYNVNIGGQNQRIFVPYSLSSATYDNANAGNGKAVTYNVNVGNLDPSQSIIDPMTGEQLQPGDFNFGTTGGDKTFQTIGNITRRLINVNPNPSYINKLYDGNASGPTGELSTDSLIHLNPGDDGATAAQIQDMLNQAGVTGHFSSTYDNANASANDPTDAARAGRTVTYDVNLTGAGVNNFTFSADTQDPAKDATLSTTSTGRGDILRRKLYLDTDAIHKTYDNSQGLDGSLLDTNNTPATLDNIVHVVGGDGVVAGENVGLNFQNASGTYADKNVNRPAVGTTPQAMGVTYRGITLSGDPNGNYRLLDSGTGQDVAQGSTSTGDLQGTGTITPRDLNVSLRDPHVRKTYDGTTNVPDAYSPANNLQVANNIDGYLPAVNPASYADPNAGTNKDVAYQLSMQNPNYELRLADGVSGQTLNGQTLTSHQGEIDPKALHMTARDGANKDYDGTTNWNSANGTPDQWVDYSGFVHGEGRNVLGETVTAQYNHPNAADSENVDETPREVTYTSNITNGNYIFDNAPAGSPQTGTATASGNIHRLTFDVNPNPTSQTITQGQPIPNYQATIRGSFPSGGTTVNPNDFTYTPNVPNTQTPVTGAQAIDNVIGRYNGQTSGNYGLNYKFVTHPGSLTVNPAQVGPNWYPLPNQNVFHNVSQADPSVYTREPQIQVTYKDNGINILTPSESVDSYHDNPAGRYTRDSAIDLSSSGANTGTGTSYSTQEGGNANADGTSYTRGSSIDLNSSGANTGTDSTYRTNSSSSTGSSVSTGTGGSLGLYDGLSGMSEEENARQNAAVNAVDDALSRSQSSTGSTEANSGNNRVSGINGSRGRRADEALSASVNGNATSDNASASSAQNPTEINGTGNGNAGNTLQNSRNTEAAHNERAANTNGNETNSGNSTGDSDGIHIHIIPDEGDDSAQTQEDSQSDKKDKEKQAQDEGQQTDNRKGDIDLQTVGDGVNLNRQSA